MKYAKKTVAVAALVTMLGVGTVGVGTSLAAQGRDRVDARQEMMAGLVTAIAEKFNLDEAEVQEVFDGYRKSHQDERLDHKRHAQLEERLDQAVADGELTQVEADMVWEKRQEMKEYVDSLGDLSSEERKEAIQEQVDELEEWAEANDIPMEFLRFGPGPKGGRSPRESLR